MTGWKATKNSELFISGGNSLEKYDRELTGMTQVLDSVELVPHSKQEFEKVVLVHLNTLYHAALSMTRKEEEAKDLVQETCIKAYRFFHRFERGTNCKAWLLTILRNTYINRYRKQQREPLMLDLQEMRDLLQDKQQTTPEGKIYEDESRLRFLVHDEVKRALDNLLPEFRLVVIMADMEGYSYREIAQVLECPIGTVMSRLHRGRRLLKRILRG